MYLCTLGVVPVIWLPLHLRHSLRNTPMWTSSNVTWMLHAMLRLDTLYLPCEHLQCSLPMPSHCNIGLHSFLSKVVQRWIKWKVPIKSKVLIQVLLTHYNLIFLFSVPSRACFGNMLAPLIQRFLVRGGPLMVIQLQQGALQMVLIGREREYQISILSSECFWA